MRGGSVGTLQGEPRATGYQQSTEDKQLLGHFIEVRSATEVLAGDRLKFLLGGRLVCVERVEGGLVCYECT